MEHDSAVRKLMDYKQKLEEREVENQKIRAKRDALLEQAESRYGTKTIEELEAHRDKLYAQYTKALEEVNTLNARLDAFFAGV